MRRFQTEEIQLSTDLGGEITLNDDEGRGMLDEEGDRERLKSLGQDVTIEDVDSMKHDDTTSGFKLQPKNEAFDCTVVDNGDQTRLTCDSQKQSDMPRQVKAGPVQDSNTREAMRDI